ncbi:MAG: histidine kinase [Bacteroidota bacterium]
MVLRNLSLKRIADYSKLLIYISLEFAFYYGCNVLINNYLKSSGWPVEVIDPSSPLFHLGTFYRFIYIVGLSTAFRVTINFLESQKNNHDFVTETLIRERENESLRTELVTAQNSLLRSQVNPHFLFNSLNSLYNRIRKNDPNSAMYVMALADLMRYALQETTSDEVPVESELDYISNYLKLQSMRYSTEVDISIKVDEPDLKIAALLLINIVENVFKHGDLKNADCRPFIRIIVSNGELLLETKNYIRPDHSPGNGVGLINVRKRLEYQYKDRFEFDYAAEGKIFNVKLFIKLR